MKPVHYAMWIDANGVTHVICWDAEFAPYGWRTRCDYRWVTTPHAHQEKGHGFPTCALCAVQQ